MISFILQMKKLMPREVKSLAPQLAMGKAEMCLSQS